MCQVFHQASDVKELEIYCFFCFYDGNILWINENQDFMRFNSLNECSRVKKTVPIHSEKDFIFIKACFKVYIILSYNNEYNF